MPRRHCRICKKRTSKGSALCDAHRAQAEVFAATFGRKEGPADAKTQEPPPSDAEIDGAEAPSADDIKATDREPPHAVPEQEDERTTNEKRGASADEDGEASPKGEPEGMPVEQVAASEDKAKTTKSEETSSEAHVATKAGTKPQVPAEFAPMAGLSTPVKNASTPQTTRAQIDLGDNPTLDPESEDVFYVSEMLPQTLASVATILSIDGSETIERWPQVSVYYVDDRLMARPYFSVIPTATEESTATDTFSFDSDVLQETLQKSGAVLSRFLELFLGRRQALKDASVRTLDVHFLTYAGVIAINERVNKQERNIAAFKLAGGKFIEVPLADVHSRLRHTRWAAAE